MNDDGDGDDASIDFLFLFRKQDEEEEDPAALVGSFKRCKKEIQHSLAIIFEGFGILGTNELSNTVPCGNRLQASE